MEGYQNAMPMHAGKTTINTGMDPMMAALMGGGGGNGGFGGGGNNGFMSTLLTLGLLGGNRNGGGLFGGGNNGNGSDAVAAASITTPKDVAAQLNTMTASQCNANHEIQEGICQLGRAGDQNTASVIQGQSAQNLQQSQQMAALTQAITSGNYALATQLAKCCCDNQLAVEQTKNLINVQGLTTQNLINTTSCATQNQISTATMVLSNQADRNSCDLKQHNDDNTKSILAAITQQNIDALRSDNEKLTIALNACSTNSQISNMLAAQEARLTAVVKSCPCGTVTAS